MLKIVFFFLFLMHNISHYINMAKQIKCFQQEYNQTIADMQTINCINGKCMENFCLDKKAKSPQCDLFQFGRAPCFARRRGCDDGKNETDDTCDGGDKKDYYYMKDLRRTCKKDRCNAPFYTENINCIEPPGLTRLFPCNDGCITSYCKGGKKQANMLQDCYDFKICNCENGKCDKECTGVHTCSMPCFTKHCNKDPPPTTTSTASTMITTENSTTAITTKTTNLIIGVDHKGLRIINGWVQGKAKPFGLTKMEADSCGDGGKSQINLDVTMKICVAKDSNCTGGLILCYQSRMSGIQQNPKSSKVNMMVANRTLPFRLDNVEGPIGEKCNGKEKDDDGLWADWVNLETHGITLSSSADGKSVEIRTSYDQRIFEAKLNADGCAVFHFNRNKTTGVEGTLWKLKGAEDTDEDDDEGEETSSSSVVTSSPTTTLTDNATTWSSSNNSSSNVTVQTEQQEKETEQEQTETTMDGEQTPTDEKPETEEPVTVDWRENFDEHFWAKLRGGVPLDSFDPLMTLPLDVLAGVGPDQEKLFTVVQDQQEGQCRMRVTFHPECLDEECLATTNL